MIIGHIGARKGSKGVKGKNFITIAGKKLIDWSLDQLLNNKLIDKVFVSTDDEEIYNHCISKGTLDLGLRPKKYAYSSTSKWKVWEHSLNLIEKKVCKVQTFVDLDCTAPLRTDDDLNRAMELYFKIKPDMVMACCEARRNPYFNLLEYNKKGSLEVSKKLKKYIVARQEAPLVLEHSSTYIINPKYLKKSNFLYGGKVIPCMMSAENCMDIDTELDLKIVEFLLKQRSKL